MCCNTSIPDQMMIYNQLLQNKRARHLQSIAHLDEFQLEIKDLKIRKSFALLNDTHMQKSTSVVSQNYNKSDSMNQRRSFKRKSGSENIERSH